MIITFCIMFLGQRCFPLFASQLQASRVKAGMDMLVSTEISQLFLMDCHGIRCKHSLYPVDQCCRLDDYPRCLSTHCKRWYSSARLLKSWLTDWSLSVPPLQPWMKTDTAADWQHLSLCLQKGKEDLHQHRHKSQADATINNAWTIEPEEEPSSS